MVGKRLKMCYLYHIGFSIIKAQKRKGDLMNPKSKAKIYGHVMSELQDLPDEQQEIALYYLLLRIRELKLDTNKHSHKRTKSPAYCTDKELY